MYFITRHIGIEAVPVKIFDVELKRLKIYERKAVFQLRMYYFLSSRFLKSLIIIFTCKTWPHFEEKRVMEDIWKQKEQ